MARPPQKARAGKIGDMAMNTYQLLLNRIWRILLTLLLLSLWTLPARAQSPITAMVDRTSISTDDFVNLTVVVSSQALSTPSPDLPPLDGFDIVGTSTSTQISMVGTTITSEGRYQFRLRPTKSGTLTIPAISVTIDGQTYSTAPITIEVTAGSAPAATPSTPKNTAPAPDKLHGQDFFVEASINNDTPFVGEQIVYTFRFYQGINLMDQPRYDAPSFTGFLNQRQPEQTQYTTQSAGRTYRVTELHTILFPTTAGENTIEPAVLTIPGGFFSSGEILSTDPINVTVKELPPNAPADFTGAVGDFTIEASLNSTETKVNEPVTLNVTISGEGNLEALPDPIWADLPNWRAFESKATTNTRFQDGRLVGTRIYERLLVPTVAGNTAIPAIRYTYFDPVVGTYRTLKTAPIPVRIAPASATTPVPPISGNGKQAVSLVATDIRHIKAMPTTLRTGRAPVTHSVGYWLLWGLPLLALAGNLIWVRRTAQLRQNVGLARRLRAHKLAKKSLATIRNHADDPYGDIRRTVIRYLSDKFNRAVEGLTLTALKELLAESGLPHEVIGRVESVLGACDMGRFSPLGDRVDQSEELLQLAETLIDDLESLLE